MKKLTGKRAQRFIELYETSRNWRLSDIYKNYSCAKEHAYRECINYATENDARLVDGLYWKIISHNQMQFTFAFLAGNGLHVITKDNHYIINNYLPF